MYNPKSQKWRLNSGGSIALLSMRITKKHFMAEQEVKLLGFWASSYVSDMGIEAEGSITSILKKISSTRALFSSNSTQFTRRFQCSFMAIESSASHMSSSSTLMRHGLTARYSHNTLMNEPWLGFGPTLLKQRYEEDFGALGNFKHKFGNLIKEVNNSYRNFNKHVASINDTTNGFIHAFKH